MDYNARLSRLAGKYNQFFTDTTPGQILAMICPYTFAIDYKAFGIRQRWLNEWDFDTETERFARAAKASLDAWLTYTRGLDNDYFPALSPNLGYGAHSAFFSPQAVILGKDTSWTHPCIAEWADMDQLRTSENNYWYQKIMEITSFFVQWQEGDYAVSGFANAGPGDMANALRGNQLFYDIYDAPEMVHQLMERCVAPTVWLEKQLQNLTGDVLGGSIAANCWFPGRVPYLSGDFSDLCPPWVFREFEASCMQRIIDAFDGAFIHHHAKGLHVHGDFAKLRGLTLLEISWDPNEPRPIDMLPAIYEMNGGVPLMVRCHARDVAKYIDQLKASRTVLMLNIDTLDEGREVMRLIRRNSII